MSKKPSWNSVSFNPLRKNHERDIGGGLVFLLHNTVQYRLFDGDNDRSIGIRSGDDKLEIFTVYIPPVTYCPTGYHLKIGALLRGKNRLVLGGEASTRIMGIESTSQPHRTIYGPFSAEEMYHKLFERLPIIRTIPMSKFKVKKN